MAAVIDWQLSEDPCRQATGPRVPDQAEIERIEEAVREPAGVVDARATFDTDTCPGQVTDATLFVTLAPDAPADQILAAVPPVADSMRIPAFAAVEVTLDLVFAFDERTDLGSLHVSERLPDGELHAEMAAWINLVDSHPGTMVVLHNLNPGQLGRIVEVPVARNGDPTPVSTAFADLRALELPDRDNTTWRVQAGGIPERPDLPTDSEFTAWGELPSDETVEQMVSAVSRPASVTQTGVVEARVEWHGPRAPFLEAFITIDDTATPAPAVQEVATAYAAQVKAASPRYSVLVMGTSGQTLASEGTI
ncbi:MAG: hypothetical protein ACRDQ0_02655 [Pseudonocardia sp.]